MKKTSKKIQDNGFGYALCRRYVCLLFRLSYRKYEVCLAEPLPTDGAVIFAPNHTNALMDALAILNLGPGRKVFVARADIFQNPAFARFLTFLKIMPIHRIRDGRSALRRNDEIIRRAVDVLCDRVPFCILPEGTHRPMHSLLPLGKGIFRIALQARKALQETCPVYIVPVGLEYGNFFRYRSSLLVQTGPALNIRRVVAEHPAMEEGELMLRLKDRLSQAMKDLILYIPDDAHYEASYELCNLLCNHKLKTLGLRFRSLQDRLKANRHTLGALARLRAEEPERAQALLARCQGFGQERKRRRISMASVANRIPRLSFAGRILFLVGLFPFFVPAALLSFPLELPRHFVCKALDDPAFRNSVNYVILLALWPLLFLLWAVAGFLFLPWPWVLAAMAVAYPAPLFYLEYLRWGRIFLSDLRWLRARDLRKAQDEILHQAGI